MVSTRNQQSRKEATSEDNSKKRRLERPQRGFHGEKDMSQRGDGPNGQIISKGRQNNGRQRKFHVGVVFPILEKRRRFFPIDIRELETRHFLGPESMVSEDRGYGEITLALGRGSVDAVQESLDFVPGNVFGPRVPAETTREDHVSGEIGPIFSVEVKKSKEGPTRGDESSQGANVHPMGKPDKEIINGLDVDVSETDSMTFQEGAEAKQFFMSLLQCDFFEALMVAAEGDVVLQEFVAKKFAVWDLFGFLEMTILLAKDKGQEASNGILNVSGGLRSQEAIGFLFEITVPVSDVSLKERRRDIRQRHFSINDPIMEGTVITTDLPDAFDVVFLIKQMPQVQLPIGSEPRKPIDKGFRSPIKDFSKSAFVGRITAGDFQPVQREIFCRVHRYESVMDRVNGKQTKVIHGALKRVNRMARRFDAVQVIVRDGRVEIRNRELFGRQIAQEKSEVIPRQLTDRGGFAGRFEEIGIGLDEFFIHERDSKPIGTDEELRGLLRRPIIRKAELKYDSELIGPPSQGISSNPFHVLNRTEGLAI